MTTPVSTNDTDQRAVEESSPRQKNLEKSDHHDVDDVKIGPTKLSASGIKDLDQREYVPAPVVKLIKEKVMSRSESADDVAAATGSPSSEKKSWTSATTEASRSLNSIEELDGRERIKRHRKEVAGRVWIPEIWGQEELLKDWTDCSGFEASLMNNTVMSARAALIEEGRRANSAGLRMERSC